MGKTGAIGSQGKSKKSMANVEPQKKGKLSKASDLRILTSCPGIIACCSNKIFFFKCLGFWFCIRRIEFIFSGVLDNGLFRFYFLN